MKQIPLTQGKVALVDDEDFEYLNQWKWYAAKDGNTYYAIRSIFGGKKKIIMHRLIMEVMDQDILIDHNDHDGLNNQRSNLRSCSDSENMRNRSSAKNSTSKYLGVHWKKSRNKWRAQMTVNKKTIELGCFDNEIEAAKAYDKKSLELYGEFANINFKHEKPDL